MNFKVVVFTDNQEIFKRRQSGLAELGFPADRVLWGDSSVFSRSDMINRHCGGGIFFLDHDCYPSSESFALANRIFSEASSDFCLAGMYMNPHDANLMQRVHNFIANGWLENSFLSGGRHGFLLGGVFLVRVSEPLKGRPSGLFWGAEDKALAELLNESRIRINYEPRLQVIHKTSSSFLHFIRRAWLHGVNEVKYIQGEKSKINFLYWLKKAGFANLSLMPLVLLHFCIQKTALLFQTIRPGNK